MIPAWLLGFRRRDFSGGRVLRGLFVFSALAVAALFSPSFWGAGAQATLGEPQILPGDAGPVIAAGTQEHAQLARGADSSLAVWTDLRAALNPGAPGTLGLGVGSGSMNDIYAARIAPDGRVIDTTPIVVTQVGYNQTRPVVAWNGENWLVVWLHQVENDYYKFQIKAARVSPAGQLLDATPTVLDDTAHSGQYNFSLTDDGAGNWVVTWEDFLPPEGTSIPRGVFAMKVGADAAVLAPGARVIYNHHHQYMDGSKLTRAGDRYLLTYHDVVSPFGLYGIVYDAGLNQLSAAPVLLTEWGPTDYGMASDGNSWFGSWFDRGRLVGMRISRDGAPLDAAFIVINSNLGNSASTPRVAWDGQYWFVAYGSGFDPVTQTQLPDADVYASRVTPAGEVIDQSGFKIKSAPGPQSNILVAPGAGGGAQVAWYDVNSQELFTARVSPDGSVGADVPYTLGAPRQAKVRTAASGSGFLAVFRSETSGASRVMAQRVNADGTPADQEPFAISPADQTTADNPSVGWDGANYLVVWDAAVAGARKTYGAIVPASGPAAGAPFFIANGFMPDAAGLDGRFLVVNILQETSQIKTTQATLVGGGGAPLGAAFKIQRAFNTWPRVAAFGNRWLAVWEFHGNHDDSPGTIHGAFVERDGTFGGVFAAGDFGSDGSPHLAVNGDATQALVVWGAGDIRSRRINPDGSSPEPLSGMPVTADAARQALPAVAWDGSQYVVTWIDHRNETFPLQPKGDIYAARVSAANVKIEDFPVANSALPEELPSVSTLGGLTLFSYSKFYPQPYSALRVTTRTGRFAAPQGTRPALAPANLSATQVNSGLGTATLQWVDTNPDEQGFKLEIGSGDGTFRQIQLLAANATTATVNNLGTTTPSVFRLRAYNAAGDGDYSNVAGPPSAVMTRLTQNTFNEPASVPLAATASDPDGVARVEFLSSTDGVNYALLATDAEAPYSYQWQNVGRGLYYVKARAYDATGSHTTSYHEGFAVNANPAAVITSPAEGSVFAPGSPVTITATAQTRNSGETLTKVDFYANSTPVGTVGGNLSSYQFTWTNPPAGSYQLTARPTSSLNLVGTSAPVNITVNAPAPPPARIDAVSPNPVTRSGLVRITGVSFGPQDAGRLTIDGKSSPFVAQWSDTMIVAYVPETSALGSVNVSVSSAAGAATAPLNVTTRTTEGRIRWRFTVASGHTPRRSAIGPDGTVYLNDVKGRLYALAPDGALKWVFQAGLVGARGPVSVGADGTIYVGGLVPRDPSTPCEGGQFLVNVDGVFAVRPDGTQKWLFDKTCDSLLSGPNVGPDGNIHAVTDSTGIGAFALTPDGTFAHAPTGRFGIDGDRGTEIVFGPATPGEAPTRKYFQYESGGLFGYTLEGQRVFLHPTNAAGITQPVAGQRTGTVYTSTDQQTAGRFFAVSPQGALRWVSPIRPVHSFSIPDAPPSESAVYVVQDGARLHRLNPEDGSIVWTFIDNFEQLFDPVASPDDRLVLMGGQANYGLPGFFEAVSRDGRQLWKQHLPDEPGFAPYGQVVPKYRARFTGDGQTAYVAAHVAGADYSTTIPAYSFFYALDTTDTNVPINRPPTATLVSPVNNSEVAKGAPLDIKARVEDDGPIGRVEFLAVHNGTQTLVGTDATPDADGLYSVRFTPAAPGVYGLVAVAYDAAGLSGKSASSTLIATNQPPAVSWVSPANNATFAAPAGITLTVSASDSDGTISIVHFNSHLLGEIGQDATADADGNYQIVWSNPPQGTHTLSVRATDNNGHYRFAEITVTVGPASTPTPTPTPAPTYSISGTVRDAGGSPVVGVTVTLSGNRSASAQTDAQGNYSFASLPAGGNYNVAASRPDLTFAPPSRDFANLGGDQRADFTPDPPALIQFSAAALSVGEGNGPAAITVNRTQATGTAVSVNYSTADGAANAGSDYAATSGTLNFAAGETTKTVLVPILDDAAVEGAEAFTVTLGGPAGSAALGTPASATVTITENDSCSYTAGRQTPDGFTAAGGQGNFEMIAPVGCAWTASSLAPWITITSGASGSGDGTVAFTAAPNDGPARTGQILRTGDSFVAVSQAAGASSFSLDATTLTPNEGAGRAEIKIVRGGDTSKPASVTFQTVDDPADVPCATLDGRAYARCDYPTTVETLTWAAGDSQPKTVSIPLIDDSRAEGAETLRIRITDPQGGVLSGSGVVMLTVEDNDTSEGGNPITGNSFFVRMQYLDFLNREPEAGEPWTGVLARCPDVNNTAPDSPSAGCDRTLVSQSFFQSPEFQLKGYYSYLFYRVAFDRRPEYSEIIPDMRGLAGSTGPEVFARRAAHATALTQRQEFASLYGGVTNQQYVEALLGRYGLQQITTEDPRDFEGAAQATLTRQQLLDALNSNSLTRAQVLRAVVQSSEVDAAEYHGAFVAMQYYGYLRRTPEQSGYDAWLRVIRQDPNNVRVMVNGFANSQEYRLRFGQP